MHFLGVSVVPKLYEYLGIVIFFYSNEHEPIHVHGRCGDSESKIEMVIENATIKRPSQTF